MTLRALVPALAAALASPTLVPAPLHAQRPAVPERPDAFVAATRAFVFHSDARMNLHDFLLWRVQSEEPVDPRPACLAALPDDQRAAFQAAEDRYRARWSRVDPGHARDVLGVRYHLAGWPAVELGDAAVVGEAEADVEAALPAYRACWWADHDARNRRWIGELVARLLLHEDTLAARIGAAHRSAFELPVPVDVAGHVNFSGANTVVDPDHILLSPLRPNLQGDLALETVFHEASHTLLGPRSGAAAEALARQARALGLDGPPRDAWHILLFHTAGWETRRRLAETGEPGYRIYLDAAGLFQRAWPGWGEPLERWWGAYLAGELSMDDAVRGLLQAVPAG